MSRYSHVESDHGTLDSRSVNLVKVFKISVNSLGGGEGVDLGGLDFPGTSSASAFWHNFREVSIFVVNGFLDALFVATEFSGGLDEVFSENFVHNSFSL